MSASPSKALVVQSARNHPVWLRRPIPDDAVIDFDAWTDSPEGDIKVEAWGDGPLVLPGPDPRGAYEATGYVLVMGGWRNTLSAIARRNEHANDRVARAEPAVECGPPLPLDDPPPGRNALLARSTGKPFLTMTDPQPLRDPGSAPSPLRLGDAGALRQPADPAALAAGTRPLALSG